MVDGVRGVVGLHVVLLPVVRVALKQELEAVQIQHQHMDEQTA